jgi:hypothetical protein
VSSIDSAVAALVALFTTAVPTAQVVDGPPDAASLTGQQVVAVGDQEITGTSEFDSMALVTTTENYIVPITVSVSLPGNSMSAARNAAILLYETLKAAILVDPSLGFGPSFQASPTGEWSLPQQADENGRHAAFRWGVHVIATNT